MTTRYLMQVAAHNLGVVMRSLFGVGKPRTLRGGGRAELAVAFGLLCALACYISRWYGTRP